MVAFLKEFHCNGRIVRGLNSTFIVLIPSDSPQRMEDYRPISLIESLHKILSKLLAGRLQKVIHCVIYEPQSAFIKGKQVLDGVLIANELVDEAKKLKKQGVLFKADFEKAYDSVSWKYLKFVLGKMGFDKKWINWMMECVTSTSISVLVNGSPTDEFGLSRGLRQGHLLSPFLFLIVAEGLSVMVKDLVLW